MGRDGTHVYPMCTRRPRRTARPWPCPRLSSLERTHQARADRDEVERAWARCVGISSIIALRLVRARGVGVGVTVPSPVRPGR